MLLFFIVYLFNIVEIYADAGSVNILVDSVITASEIVTCETSEYLK